jgi:hypothetical protein
MDPSKTKITQIEGQDQGQGEDEGEVEEKLDSNTDFVIDDNGDIEEQEQEEGEVVDGEGEIVEAKRELILSQKPKMSIKSSEPKYNQSLKKYKKFEGNPQDQLNLISEHLLTSEPIRGSTYEMEAKFGTKGIKQISKIDYDNVIRKLKSLAFRCENENGEYSLKIQPEAIYRGELSVAGNFDLFRVEINGLLNIQEYCKTNNIKSLNQKNGRCISVLQKYDAKEIDGESIHSADFDDFNFRVTLKTERNFNKNNPKVANLFETWNNKKKYFDTLTVLHT